MSGTINRPASALAQAVQDYLTLRRAMGYQLRTCEYLLRDFAGFLQGRGATTVTIHLALQWAMQPADASPAWWAARLSTVRGFAVYLATLDPATEIPPAGLLPHHPHRPAPYLYSPAEIADLLRAASRLAPPLRAATYTTMFGLLAITGMRVGEAIHLGRDDVHTTEALLTIRRSKFNSSRQLPLHASTVTALTSYAQLRDRLCPNPQEATFFLSTRGTALIYNNVRAVFRQVIRGLTDERRWPPERRRINDLRHSFAVTALMGWHAAGLDVDARLPLLSAYLGHADPAATYWYYSDSRVIPMSAPSRACWACDLG